MRSHRLMEAETEAAVEMMGLCSGEVRLPLIPIGEENRKKLRDALTDAGVSLR